MNNVILMPVSKAIPVPVRITLTPFEMFISNTIGSARRFKCITEGKKPRHGFESEDTWQVDIESARTEMSVAKHLNIFWSGDISSNQSADVGPHQVRSRNLNPDNYKHKPGSLILHPDDKDNDLFFFVIGTNGIYDIYGWMYGREGKQGQYWSDPTGNNRAAFFVPVTDLGHM